jgi:hypothetical protein
MAETRTTDRGTNVKLGRHPARFTRASILRGRVLKRHLGSLGPAPTASPDYVSVVIKNVPAGWGWLRPGKQDLHRNDQEIENLQRLARLSGRSLDGPIQA